MCHAFAMQGHDVTLLCKRGGAEDPFVYYGLPRSFRIESLPRPARRGGEAVFIAHVARALWAHRQAELFFCRDMAAAVVAASLRLPFAFEFHAVPTGVRATVLRRAVTAPSYVGSVAISHALARDLAANGFRGPLLVAHDGATRPAALPPRSDAQMRVGYVGALLPGRGLECIASAAVQLPHIAFDWFGGAPADIAVWQRRVPPNVRLHGHVSPADLAGHYRSLGIVLLPYPRTGVTGATGKTDTSKWTSPLKMFEYMASGAAIIASDLPVLGEILRHEGNALICPADDPPAWRDAIVRLCLDEALRLRLAEQAHSDLAAYTWQKRAEEILSWLSAQGRGAQV